MTIQSASRSVSSRSAVTSPMIRIARPGPGNGWRRTIASGRPSSRPTSPDLVLEQVAQRLDQLEAQVGGQAADVVVGLDLLGGLRLRGRALDDVGIERALGQEVDGADLERLLLEDPDELVADDLALLLGVLDAGQPGQEALARVDHDQVHPEVLARRSRGAAPDSFLRIRPWST